MNVASGAVDGWSEWDRRFCVLCVADHGGDWERLSERLFDPSVYGQSGSASNGEAFWSHVLDLRRRLDEAGLDAAAVVGELVIAKGVAAEARRKVFKRALANNEPSVPMIQTPRVRLAQRAATGNWDGFPVSPQPFHDRLVLSSGIDRWTRFVTEPQRHTAVLSGSADLTSACFFSGVDGGRETGRGVRCDQYPLHAVDGYGAAPAQVVVQRWLGEDLVDRLKRGMFQTPVVDHETSELATRVVGHQGSGYPVASAPGQLRRKLVDATGYPLPPRPSCGRPTHSMLSACC